MAIRSEVTDKARDKNPDPITGEPVLTPLVLGSARRQAERPQVQLPGPWRDRWGPWRARSSVAWPVDSLEKVWRNNLIQLQKTPTGGTNIRIVTTTTTKFPTTKSSQRTATAGNLAFAIKTVSGEMSSLSSGVVGKQVPAVATSPGKKPAVHHATHGIESSVRCRAMPTETAGKLLS